MPDAVAQPPRSRRNRPARRPAATRPAQRPASQPTSLPTTQPAELPTLPIPTARDADEPYASARRRLARLPAAQREPEDHALLAALDFVLALDRGDGAKAAERIDAVGYTALPLTGELPEKPDKPLLPAAVADRVKARGEPTGLGAAPRLDEVPLHTVRVLTPPALREEFPAVALWMLPQDLAVVFRAPEDGPARGWLTCPACVVVRIRADRATIIGGNLLDALTPP